MEAKITKLKEYIHENPVAILSTSSNSQPHGAAVYVCADGDNIVYFATKEDTRKFKFLKSNPRVALTIVKPSDNSTLQAEGVAKVLNDEEQIADVFNKLVKIYATIPDWLPPITKINAGSYQIVEIKLTYARLAHFKGKTPGEDVFTEINL